MSKQILEQLIQANDLDKAEVLARSLLDLDGKDVSLKWALANILLGQQKFEEGVRALFQVCETASPFYWQAVELASTIAFENELWGLVIGPTLSLLKAGANADEANFRLGVSYLRLDRLVDASEHLKNVSENSDRYFEAQYFCGIALSSAGFSDLARVNLEASLASKVKRIDKWRDYIFELNNCAEVSSEYIAGKHFEYGRLLTSMALSELSGFKKEATGGFGTSLKIGFFSSDFCGHSVTAFMLPILRALGEVNWEVSLYSCRDNEDKYTVRLKELSSHWHDVSSMNAQERLEYIRSNDEDVIVDLMGAACPFSPLELAARMAPVQVAYLGYPNTSGLESIDYRITDFLCDPENQDDRALYTERLYRLDDSFLRFESFSEVEPRYKEKPNIVFGSFNSATKYTDEMAAAWSNILIRVPNSTLVLKSKAFLDPNVVDRVVQRFVDRGVDAKRIKPVAWTETKEAHLKLYDEIDVHLDTSPYNGTTTTFECLWQGVPTVAFWGDHHRSRVSASILTRLGKSEWVASSVDEYVEKAVLLASKRNELIAFKADARDELFKAGLLDGTSLVKSLDLAFRAMYAEAVSG